MTDDRQSHLGDVIGEPLLPMRPAVYRNRNHASDWISAGTAKIVGTVATAFYIAILAALLVLAFMFAAQPTLAQDAVQVRRDCRVDALRYCPADVWRYVKAQSPDNRTAIIMCMILHRDKLQEKCGRHLN